jgi:sugar phosphate isomerase/epimerase
LSNTRGVDFVRNPITDKVQVNIPFTMLHETYMGAFLERRLNPEIGVDAAALESRSIGDFGEIAKALKGQGLSVTLHGPFMDLAAGSPDPAVRALTRSRLDPMVRLAGLFDAKAVICHAGYDRRRYGSLQEVWLEKSLEVWSWLGERVQEAGSRLMLENVYEDGPQDLLRLLQALDRLNVGFCLDTGHAAAFSRTGLDEWVRVLHPYLGQLHLHDNHGDMDEHLALGEGSIDFEGFLRQVRARKASAPLVTIEPHREEDLMPSLVYLERVWPW